MKNQFKPAALAVLGFLFTLNTASAQTETTTPPPAQSPAPTAPVRTRDSSIGERSTSQSNREDKEFVFTAQPLGFGPSAIVTQGVSAGFLLNPDAILQVDFIGNNDEEYNDETDLKVRSLSVSYKQFLGNSFYVKPGIEHRWVREDYHDDGANEFWGYKGTMTGVQFAVGNQWQIKNFTIGCDWFGFTQSFLHSRTDEYTRGANLGSSQSDLDDEAEDSLEGLTFKFAHFYLGVAF